jgi:hypothetical protein
MECQDEIEQVPDGEREHTVKTNVFFPQKCSSRAP